MKSKCIKCLHAILLAEYLRNDFYCDACNETEETFPHASDSHFETFTPKELENEQAEGN